MPRIRTGITKRLKEAKPERTGGETKFSDRVTKRNPKVYEGKEDPMILGEWIRQIQKIFDVVEVTNNKRINIWTFYLSGTTDMWCLAVKTTFQS